MEQMLRLVQVIKETGYTITEIKPPVISPWVKPGTELLEKYEYIFVYEDAREGSYVLAHDSYNGHGIKGTYFMPGRLCKKGLVIGTTGIRKPELNITSFAFYLRGSVINLSVKAVVESIEDIKDIINFYNLKFSIREVCEKYVKLFRGDITKEEIEALSKYVSVSTIETIDL